MVPGLRGVRADGGGYRGVSGSYARGVAVVRPDRLAAITRRAIIGGGAFALVAVGVIGGNVEAADALPVRIGRAIVDGGDLAAVEAAIKTANAKVRLAGLEDALNPWLIEPARAMALLEALARLPATERGKLGGLPIALSIGLPVMATSPTTMAGFAGLTGIAAVEAHGTASVVRVAMPLDCDLARRQSEVARSALERMELEVAALEQRMRLPGGDRTDLLHQLGAARLRRFALATTWRENAVADQACRPGDRGAADGLMAAEEKLARYAVPGGSLD